MPSFTECFWEADRVPQRKHRTHGESSRHKSKTASGEAHAAKGPTTSQEIANQWYQQVSSPRLDE